MGNKLSPISKAFLVLIFLILYAPIFFLVFYSFNSGGTMYDFKGFTMEWYKELFQDTRLLIIVLNTLVIALLSALIATIIGVIGAIGIRSFTSSKAKNTVLSLNNVLIVSPDVIIGASFLILFTMAGIKLGFYSVLLSHIAFSIPIVVLLVLPKLQEMSPTLIDAARDLGASRWDVLTKVILPYILPGIFAGFFMALTYSLDDFAVTFFVTGNGFSTLSVEIYSLARRGISLNINALSTLLFVVTLLLVVVYYFITQRVRQTGMGETMKRLLQMFCSFPSYPLCCYMRFQD
ncbi:ABC transporter permease [[Brevibacterium] frigoritolerans]|uniref:ABC transporter permease n=1 Tax=Peribacillus frigoritolerans TaxID=450367 RepID=A0A941FK87_9BACI|nr:ABC transporter permease [Peribacillus frigoritolerans]